VYVNHNTTVINNYTYAHNETAVTAVSRETFVNARPVAGATVRVSAQQIQSARAVETSPIAPTRTSYVSSTAHVSVNRPAVPFAQRAVVARLNPAVSRPVVQPGAKSNGQFGHDQGNPQYNSRGNNNVTGGQQATRSTTPGQNQPASRDGFRPFQPPAASPNTSNNNPDKTTGGTVNNKTENNTTQGDQRQPMRFTPPVKAKDENYDVHPPLNQHPAETQAKEPPKQETKPAKETKKDDDKKKDNK
jgi:hypothetical protein